MLSTGAKFDAKHDLDYKTPMYSIHFAGEIPNYCNHIPVIPSGVGEILLETGIDFLLEDGSGALLEEDEVKYLAYDKQTGTFTVGKTVTGAKSGATATIYMVTDDGTSGYLFLTNIVGTFQDEEIIYESALGSELLINGDFNSWAGDNPSNWTFDFTEDGTNYITENPAGQCQMVSDGAYMSMFQQPASVDGAFYQVSVDIKTVTSGSLVIHSEGEVLGTYSTIGIKKVYAQAVGATLTVRLKRVGVTDITFDDASVKQVTNAALVDGTIMDIGDRHRQYLTSISGLNSKVSPEEGKVSIGGIGFELLDYNDEITALLATDAYYFHRKRVTIKAGYMGMDEADMLTIMVGWVTGLKLNKDGLSYIFNVTDPIKWMQRKIFRGAEDSTVTISGNPLNILLALLTSGSGSGDYDWYDSANGLGLDTAYINVTEIEKVRDDWYPGDSHYMKFTINKRIKAKDFFEKEIFKPLNLYPVVDGQGRFSVKPFKPPLAALESVQSFNEDNIIGLPEWDSNLASLINEVEIKYDYDGDDFLTEVFYVDSTSLNNRGPGKKPLEIKTKGLHTSHSPASIAGRATDILATRKQRIFGRFSTPPIKLSLNTFFSRWLSEAGDVVPFTHSKIPDIEAGTAL